MWACRLPVGNDKMDGWRTGLVDSVTKYRADPTSEDVVTGCDHAVRVGIVVNDKTVKRIGETDGTTLKILHIQE